MHARSLILCTIHTYLHSSIYRFVFSYMRRMRWHLKNLQTALFFMGSERPFLYRYTPCNHNQKRRKRYSLNGLITFFPFQLRIRFLRIWSSTYFWCYFCWYAIRESLNEHKSGFSGTLCFFFICISAYWIHLVQRSYRLRSLKCTWGVILNGTQITYRDL